MNMHLLIQKVAVIDEKYDLMRNNFNWFVSECLDGLETLYGAKRLKEQ